MSKLPSFLGAPRKTEISRRIFTDLQLDTLLSDAARKILAAPCRRMDILLRQEFFSHVIRDEGIEKIKKVISLLNSYRVAFETYDACKLQGEKYYLFVRLLETYLDMCQGMESLADMGELGQRISDHFTSDEMISLRTKMSQSVKNAKIVLKRVSTFVFTYGETPQLTKFNAPSTFFQEAVSVFSKLGLEGTKNRHMVLKPHHTLSDASVELFGAEYFRLNSMLNSYTSLDFRGPLAYIRELNFYSEMREFYIKMSSYNIPYTFPSVSNEKRFITKDLYDISLITKECENIVPNDTWFDKSCPFFFLTGANGGGKTTYLRSVAINLILSIGGMPIFAREGEIYPFSCVYTHFPKDERFANTGRLHEELARTEGILAECDNDAFILFNETYSGTDDKKGYELLLKTAEEIRSRGIGGLYVTHFHEIQDTSFPILGVSIDKSDENRRTFKITRKNNEKSSYAYDILKKYGLDRESLLERG